MPDHSDLHENLGALSFARNLEGSGEGDYPTIEPFS